MAVRKYVYDFDTVLQETDGAGVTQVAYTRTGGRYGDLLCAYDGSAARYHEPDALGSTDALSDQAQAVTDRWAYRAYGTATHTTGTDATPFTWVGRLGYFADSETGLYLLGSGTRYYDHAIAHFLSPDPIWFAGGDANLFRYVQNAPLNSTDPAGLQGSFIWPPPQFSGVTWRHPLTKGPLLLNDGLISYDFEESIYPPWGIAAALRATQNWQINYVTDFKIPRSSYWLPKVTHDLILDIVNLNTLGPLGFWVDTRRIDRIFQQDYWLFVEVTESTLGFNPAGSILPVPKDRLGNDIPYRGAPAALLLYFSGHMRHINKRTDIYFYIDTTGPGARLARQLNRLVDRMEITNPVVRKAAEQVQARLKQFGCGVLEAVYISGAGMFFGHKEVIP